MTSRFIIIAKEFADVSSRAQIAVLVSHVTQGISDEFSSMEEDDRWDTWEDQWIAEDQERTIILMSSRDKMLDVLDKASKQCLPCYEEDSDIVAIGPIPLHLRDALGITNMELFL